MRRRARARSAARRRALPRRPRPGADRPAGEMARGGLGDLRGGGKVDEAVRMVDRRAGKDAGALGFAPQGAVADLVDGRVQGEPRRARPYAAACAQVQARATNRWTNLAFIPIDDDQIRNSDLRTEEPRGATRNADPFGHLERGRPARGACRPLGLGPCQEGGARSDHLQQIEAHHAGRPPALALDRVGRQIAAGDRHHGRYVRVADHRPRRRIDPSRAADRPRARPAPAAISTMAASRPARAGTRSRSRR